MSFTKYFAKNRAQGVLLVDSTSQLTFASGHNFPTDTTNGKFFISLENEIVKVNTSSQDGSGVLTVGISRGQDGTTESHHAADTTGYMYYTAEAQNNIYNAVNDIYTGAASIPSLDITGNITVGGNVDGRNLSSDGTKLDGIESGAEVNDVNSVNGFTGSVTLVTGNISDTTSSQKYATAAEKTKLGFISVTQSVDLDTMESDISTNNAKVTNANHTGDVTGAGTLGIVPAAISGKTSVTPVSGDYLLLWDATDSALKKADASNFLGGAVSSVNTFTGAVTLVTGNISDSTSTQKYTTASDISKLAGIGAGANVTSVNSFTGVVTLVTGNISDTTSTQKYATAAEKTKLGYISVTQAVDLDTIESDTATNNAKVSNAAHTGDVTGSGILGIVPAAISGRTGVTPVSGDYVLLWDATDSALKKADVSAFLSGGGGGGDVTGPASSTNTGIAIFNGTGGKTLMNSLVTIDTSSINIPGFLTVTGQARNSQQTLLSISGGVISWNLNNNPKSKIILTSDVTSFNISGININSEASIYLEQDSSSSYTIDWPNYIIWAGSVEPDISTLDSKHIISFYSYDGTGLIGTHISDDVSTIVSSVNSLTGAVTLVTGNISDTTSTEKYATAAEKTKLGFISVTQAVDLDTIESDTATNNAKVTNANHTGDVTGSAALVIVPSAISGKTGVTPVSGDYLLLWDATDSALKKVDASNFLSGGGGTGDVTGPASSTNTGIAIFNGTGGKTLMNSLVTIDTTSVTIPGFLSITGQARNTAQTALSTSGIVTWNLNNSPKANIILAGDVTSVTFSGINLNTEGTLYIQQNASTAYSIDWPLSLVWANGSTPDLTELSSKHIVSFYSYDGTGLIGAYISSTFSSGGGAVDSVNTFTGAVTLVTGNISDTTSTQKYTTAANLTKLGYISVTQAVDLDTIESDTATNNAKVTNAAHTGDVTGSGILGIVPAAISGRTAVTPVATDYLLLWDATDSLLKKCDASNFLSAGAGGDVTGPASSTNTGIAIFNGVGGKTLMNSLVTIDTTSVTIPGFLTVTGQTRQSTQTSLTTTGSFTWNINNNPAAQINALTGDVTLTISGIAINANAILYVKQHASAAKTITWPGTVVWSGGYAPDLSTVGSDHFISFYSYDGTNLIGSHATTQNMSTLQSTSGSTVTGAIAIWDGTSGTTIKDTTSVLDVSGNFTNVLSINSTVWSTFVSDMVTNTAKVTNANHTGDVTGSGVLGIVPAAISGRTGVTAVAGDYVLLWDATDSTLKKADVTDFISAVTASSTTTFTNKRVTKRVAAITDATGLDINSDNYDSGKVTLAGNRTLNYFTGTPTDHQQLMIEFIQDATGTRTVTLKDTTGVGSFRVGTDITGLVLTTTAGKKDLALFTYLSDMTGWLLTAVTKGY